MGVKYKQSTLLAVKLLSFYIQIAWRTHHRCVILMLSLNLAKVFNNVFYKRLFKITY